MNEVNVNGAALYGNNFMFLTLCMKFHILIFSIKVAPAVLAMGIVFVSF